MDERGKIGAWLTKGFSLLELVLVACIVGAISGIALPVYSGHVDKVRNAEAMARIAEIELLIEKYYSENNRYPESLAVIGKGNLLDPWGHPYEYLNIISCAEKSPAQKKEGEIKCNSCRKLGPIHPLNTDFDLYSKGKDGKSVLPINAEPSWDDIIRSYNGTYHGPARDII